MHADPQFLSALLSTVADQIAEYVKYQIDSGADCIMIFDSWGGQLPPKVGSLLPAHFLRGLGLCLPEV